MSKKYYRFFGGLLRTQTNWLNSMAATGYRLICTDKLLYEFEECNANEYQYCVEFIAEKSKASATDYKAFLEELGYTVFFKNMNLNYSIGKVRVQPWAEKNGKIATNATTYNKELFIIEKRNDGKPFELHTTHDDRLKYLKTLQKPWLFMALIFLIAGIGIKSLPFIVIGALSFIPTLLYQSEISILAKEAKTKEW